MQAQRNSGPVMDRTRRSFLKRTFAGTALTWLTTAGCRGQASILQQAAAPPPSQKKHNKPNIVFIIADDLGWRDIGYQDAEIKTPHLDKLAQSGRRFDQHYVLPTCTPTRVGLMSGLYPSRFGVLSPAYGRIFGDDTVTLPEALKRKGYATHISGKWHMGSPPECTPLKYGFTASYGYFHGQIDPYTHHYKTGVPSWHRNDRYLTEEGHATDLITREAVRVISDAHSRPFFLYVAYSVPHFPLKEPEQWTAPYSHIKDDSRRWFAASVTHMDDGIGQIVKALEETGRRDNTLVVFVSDNGGQRSWHSKSQYKGRYADKPHKVLGDNRPLRGWKGDCYEGGIRVPALVNWPGRLTPGVIKPPVHIVDWLPTLCGLAGARRSGGPPLDGRDIWPVIRGERRPPPRTLYWKTPKASAIRVGGWKLIVNNKNNRAELFNLRDDPLEKRDLAGEAPDKLAALKKAMAQVAARDRTRSKG